MGKKIIAALALVLCFLLAFAGCEGTVSTEKISKDGSASNVSSNGGFLAETGDYVYFINGEGKVTMPSRKDNDNILAFGKAFITDVYGFKAFLDRK